MVSRDGPDIDVTGACAQLIDVTWLARSTGAPGGHRARRNNNRAAPSSAGRPARNRRTSAGREGYAVARVVRQHGVEPILVVHRADFALFGWPQSIGEKPNGRLLVLPRNV